MSSTAESINVLDIDRADAGPGPQGTCETPPTTIRAQGLADARRLRAEQGLPTPAIDTTVRETLAALVGR